MFTSIIPLMILLAVIAGIILVIKVCLDKSTRSPAEKEGMKQGMLVALLTNNWLLGWLYIKRRSDYDYDERKVALEIDGQIQFYVNKAEFESRVNKVDEIIKNKF